MTPRSSSSSSPFAWLAGLFRRFFYYFGQTVAVLLLAALIFALAAGGSFVLVRHYIQGEEVLVPNLEGKTLEEAAELFYKTPLDLSLKLAGRDHDEQVPPDCIRDQYPQPGNFVKAGTVIRVRLSKGTAFISVPDVRAMHFQEAGIALRNANLREGNHSLAHNPEFREKLVAAQDPPPHALVERNTPVHLLISAGPEKPIFPMPDLYKKSLEQAKRHLSRMGIQGVSEEEQASREVSEGLIMGQVPRAGVPVTDQTPVTLQVARRPVF